MFSGARTRGRPASAAGYPRCTRCGSRHTLLGAVGFGSSRLGRLAVATARTGSLLAVAAAVHQLVNLRVLREPPAQPPPVHRAGVGAGAGPRRGAPDHADHPLAARPDRRGRPGDPRPRRRLHRRHRGDRARGRRRRPAARGAGRLAAATRLARQAARLRAARRRRPRAGCWCSSTPTWCSRRTPWPPRSTCCAVPGCRPAVPVAATARRRPRPAAGAAAAGLVVDGDAAAAAGRALPATVDGGGQRPVHGRRRRGARRGGRVRGACPGEVLDDIALARAVKRPAPGSASPTDPRSRRAGCTRAGPRPARGYRKSLWAAFGSAPAAVAVGAALAVTYVVPAGRRAARLPGRRWSATRPAR